MSHHGETVFGLVCDGDWWNGAVTASVTTAVEADQTIVSAECSLPKQWSQAICDDAAMDQQDSFSRAQVCILKFCGFYLDSRHLMSPLSVLALHLGHVLLFIKPLYDLMRMILVIACEGIDNPGNSGRVTAMVNNPVICYQLKPAT
jgi:hypothetical protein